MLAYSDLTAHTEPDWKLTIVFIYSTILSENPVLARQSDATEKALLNLPTDAAMTLQT